MNSSLQGEGNRIITINALSYNRILFVLAGFVKYAELWIRVYYSMACTIVQRACIFDQQNFGALSTDPGAIV